MSKKFTFPLLLIILFFGSQMFSQTKTTFIPQGAVWKYLDDGSNQGTAWQQMDYDDSGWASGHAQLGYGDGDEATVVGYGPNASRKYITTYFRRSFTVSDLSNVMNILVRLLRDDGAVVYLNGTEIVRSNMPSGEITYTTLAASTIAGGEEDVFYEFNVDPSLLNIGENVVAVEIHQRSQTSSDISFDFSMESSDSAPRLVRKAPYLIYTGDNSEYQILWQLRTSMQCTLKWGTTPSCSDGETTTTEYNTQHQHSYFFQNLTPATKYYYQVNVDTLVYSGSFYSAPYPDVDSLKFIVYGDNRTYPQDHNNVAHRIVELFENDPGYQSIIMNVGDLVGSGGSEESWDNEFFDPQYTYIRKMLANTGIEAVRGNHEGAGSLFRRFFPYPYIADSYWSFDYGPAHFIMLDQFVPYNIGSAEYNWLVNDLESTTKEWKFIILHKPGWSAGGHGNSSTVQTVIQPLCIQYGVKVVFAGHNHYYARAMVGGVTHITTGGGGAPLYDPNPSYPNIVVTSKSYHFCKIHLKGNKLDFTAIDSSGYVIDNFTITLTDVENNSDNFTPTKYSLSQNYPNPFSKGSSGNPTTVIKYTLPECSFVAVSFYNSLGKKVARIVKQEQPAGSHTLKFSARNLPSGIYFYRIEAISKNTDKHFIATKKMVLLK